MIQKVEIFLDQPEPVVCNETTGPDYFFRRYVNPKFLNDKVFGEDPDLVIGTSGILLNAGQLRERYGVATNFDLIRELYMKNGNRGISELKGNFSGFILDKKQNALHLFTDHLRTKNVFWFFDEQKGCLLFGSELKAVVALMRSFGYTPSLSEPGAYCLLTFGFMIGDRTLVRQISRLPPGTILTLEAGKVRTDRYYSFSTLPVITEPDETIVRTMESLFSEAVRLEYEKDREYGYAHAATLSGGFDSRMSVLHAKKLGFSDILCICFSQSGYRDERIAKQIAADNGFDLVIHALDNGNFLRKIEEAVRVNDGLVLYAGAAHLQSTMQLLDWSGHGLLHTGILWLPPFRGVPNTGPVDHSIINLIAFSNRLLDEERIRDLVDPGEYENTEIFALYERGSNALFNGYRVTEQFTEFASPFHDRDFLAYALRIPARENRFYYHKWVLSAMPEAAGYPWEHTGLKITAGRVRVFLNQVLRYLHRRWYGDDRGISMNPTEYWYRTNPALRSDIRAYYEANIRRLEAFPALRSDAEKLYGEGTLLEKTQVVTLLAAMKLHDL